MKGEKVRGPRIFYVFILFGNIAIASRCFSQEKTEKEI